MSYTIQQMQKALLNSRSKSVNSVVKGVNNVSSDLLKVATLRTPVDTTTLEKSGTKKVSSSGSSITGTVSFNAKRGSYNYAYKMDVGNYKLGAKSVQKSTRGVQSIFYNGSMKVGKGYLTDTAQKCEKGYTDYLRKAVVSGIVSSGITVK